MQRVEAFQVVARFSYHPSGSFLSVFALRGRQAQGVRS